MRLHRALAVSAVAVAATLLTALPATAAPAPDPYPAEVPDVAVAESTVVDDSGTVFSGINFLAGESITIDVTYGSSNALGQLGRRLTTASIQAGLRVPRRVVKTVTARSDGSFSTYVSLTRVGTATLTAEGLTSHAISRATVRVIRNSSSGSGLAVTGDMNGRRLAMEVGTGVGALVFGSLLVWFARGRRRRVATADAATADAATADAAPADAQQRAAGVGA